MVAGSAQEVECKRDEEMEGWKYRKIEGFSLRTITIYIRICSQMYLAIDGQSM